MYLSISWRGEAVKSNESRFQVVESTDEPETQNPR